MDKGVAFSTHMHVSVWDDAVGLHVHTQQVQWGCIVCGNDAVRVHKCLVDFATFLQRLWGCSRPAQQR